MGISSYNKVVNAKYDEQRILCWMALNFQPSMQFQSMMSLIFLMSYQYFKIQEKNKKAIDEREEDKTKIRKMNITYYYLILNAGAMYGVVFNKNCL